MLSLYTGALTTGLGLRLPRNLCLALDTSVALVTGVLVCGNLGITGEYLATLCAH